MKLNKQINMPSLVGHFLTLERCGNTYKALCPFHKDNATKSFTVYPTSAHCFGCNGHWGPIQFLEQYLNLDFRGAINWLEIHRPDLRAVIKEGPSSRHTAPLQPIPRMVLNYWFDMLGDRRDYYYSRMLTDETIDTYMLGWTGNEYVLPVWEGEPGNSNVYGVRFRKAEDDSRDISKYWGIKGRNQPRLFNSWILGNTDTAHVFIGEFDALLATQDGLAGVSSTAGQNTWLSGWRNKFSNIKQIYVIPDVGEETAAYRIASQFLGRARVCPFSSTLGIKDYTEFRQAGYTVDDFKSLVVQ